ncbi:aminoacyl tRNA synthase complex-interacting multifunctional protein 1 [Benincasa hispida]|uniref:aminoacyl tRNA synthase complex-interacting multifunctional protein 1 n=1 Tax=Benincasa hispida TaxID=102211 RepID=UPI0018FFCCD4|nr:aminoacyl tRNA synthase complex-interacting multifunctional protein 1 [Benincasa hispida]
MASLPTAAAAIANVTKTATNARFFLFSSSLSHNFDHDRPFFALRRTFSRFTPPLPKDNVASIERRRGRISRNGGRFSPSFCTTGSTEPVTSDAVIASSSTSLDKDGGHDDDDLEKKIKDAAGTLDIRVGQIIKAWRHQEADSLYVEEVDVGEPEPRLICSGLVKYIPLDQLLDRRVIVLTNLKPRNMRGIKSCGMLMAASDSLHENIELLLPHEGSFPGERIWFGSEDEKGNQPDAATPNQIQKKKIWEMVQPHLKTDGCCTAVLGSHPMRTSTGVVTSPSLKHANIS